MNWHVGKGCVEVLPGEAAQRLRAVAQRGADRIVGVRVEGGVTVHGIPRVSATGATVIVNGKTVPVESITDVYAR